MMVRPIAMRLTALTASLAIGVLAAAGGAAAQSSAPPKLDVGISVTWMGQVPIMIAADKGYFKEAGLDVDIKVVLNSSDRIAALTAGSIAWSNLGRVAVISEMARANKAFYYFANIDDSPGIEGCWARPGINSFADLKGKKVAANTSAEITFNGLLAVHGMTIKDVTYLNLSPTEMAGALSKGDIDAACVWEPLLDGVKQAAPGGKLLGTDKDTEFYKKYGTQAAPDIVIISKKLVDEHPDEAQKLALAMFNGADLTNEDPAAAAATTAHYFKKPVDEVLAQIKTFRYFGLVGWPEHIKQHTAEMQVLAQWLYDHDKIPSVPDVKQWENVSFLPKP